MQLFRESIKDGVSRAWDLAFLAMIYEHLGKTEEAIDMLRRAKALAEDDAEWGWFERREVHHLLDEAQSLIQPVTE